MYKAIVLIISFVWPMMAISQNFDVLVTDETPCKGDTIRVSHANGLSSTWTFDQSAFTIIGDASGTPTFQLVCNTLGTYSITGNDGSGNGEIEINVYGVDANFELIKGKLNSYKIDVRSNNQSEPFGLPYRFTWDFDDGNIVKDSIVEATTDEVYYSGISHTYSDSGIFNISLQVTNAMGCKASTTVIDTISSVFFAPNFFTPNGDGINDLFTARTSGNLLFSMVLYSRWGNVVFESKKPSTAVVWDGRLKSGNKVSSGVYYYVIVPEGNTNEDKLTGFVHVFLEKE